ncbi:MAG: hypothetical protein GY725_09025 [bacterium]|nr:hypothetical protein [bacterium]
MPARCPDFFLIGAMKSGTTSLQEYLQRHPQIFMCTPKEPQFFSRDAVFARGIDWYRALFAEAKKGQLCGEASTCYARHPHFGDVAGRIKAHVPDARFLFIMRHPVERAYAHYRHLMEERGVTGQALLSFEEALERIPEIIDTSLYRRQIGAFHVQFSAERFHFLTLDELRAQPIPTLAAIQRFLGVPVLDLSAGGSIESNRSGTALAVRQSRDLVGRMRRSPLLSRWIDLLPARVRQRARAWLTSPKIAEVIAGRSARQSVEGISEMTPEVRARLVERFVEPNRELAEFLGRSLPDWSE